MQQKVRMGMVGGGEGAFIGAVHRIAANIDGQIDLVCGAFSSDENRSVSSGQALFLPKQRCYASYQTMFAQEAKLPAEQRMQFVAIVTPNHLHFPIAKMAIEHGFHVLSDKPATLNLTEATSLKNVIEQHNCLYGLTHTYTGYPMIKHAQYLVASQALGNIRKVIVEYNQGWLANKNNEGSKQASWRLNKAQSGISCCMGDIGVHAANLTEYVTGLQITELCADLNTVVDNRELDDDGTVLLRFNNGGKGVLMASQIATGEENNLTLKVYGDRASIEWAQMEPNSLWLRNHNEPAQLLRAGVGELSPRAQQALRTPAGHPEGYLEAFANIYCNFAQQICAFEQGQPASNALFDVPGINEAIRGMAFIENTVAASQSATKWHTFQMDNVNETN
ncbi:Gfo/Idh/MocA family oxidoreductase [Thalassotalea sp. G2M2-11]|uniref:Gfo/Idh/MocA family protein n=1 Tax=Thalassotalea sp. G2M2-11 TaxID=2787627 RepID=UPI0019D1DED8|nr:Gfo/Idh/MocA family oxidoreductase [Thalassotalea sp. G2M2-11]